MSTKAAYTGAMTDDTTPWLSDEEQALWRAWLAVEHDFPAALARQLSTESQLSMPDYVVLVHLTESDDGRLRASELASQLVWERSRLSHHIARMETRGLVARQECTEDKRGAFVVVTDRGRQALADAAPGHVRAVRRHFIDALDGADRKALKRILGKITATLPDQG